MAAFRFGFSSAGGEAPRKSVLYLRHRTAAASPKSYFGENEISPGFDWPFTLSTGRPPFSTRSGFGPHGVLPPLHPAMDSSPGFASTARCSPILKARFHCGLQTTSQRAKVTRWLILQKARRHRGNPSAPTARGGARFQVLFHSPSGVLFTFPSRYWFAIGHRESIQPWRAVPLLQPGFTCPAVLGMRVRRGSWDSRTGPSPAPAGLSMPFRFPDRFCNRRRPATGRALRPPGSACEAHRLHGFKAIRVRSPLLARSRLIFLSSGYLDVSSSPVAPCPPMGSAGGARTPLWQVAVRRPAGQSVFCRSPQIIAACRVLRNLPMPRHPPCARNIFASFALSPALRRGRRSVQKKYFRVSISMFICDRDMRTTCDNPEDRLFENESEGFSLMILTSVNAMQLSRCPAGRKTARRRGRPRGTGARKAGMGHSSSSYTVLPMRGEPMSTSGAQELSLDHASGRKGPISPLEREVIQPHLRYGYLVTTSPPPSHTFGASAPQRVRPATSEVRTTRVGVTGGVYKARERIHRGVLIRDY